MQKFFFLLFFSSIVSSFAQIPSEWKSAGMGGGGALFEPSISPHNWKKIFVACDMSEEFYSTNFGDSWSQVHFTQLQASGTTGKIEFTSDPNICYTINYKGEIRKPAKSTDGGLTWTNFSSDPTNGEAYYLFADPRSTQRIILTDYTNFYFTNNGGEFWEKKFSLANGCHIAGVFWHENTIYAATNEGMYLSDSSGTKFTKVNWTGIPADEAIVSFSAGKSSGNPTFFYCVTLGKADVYPGITGAEFSNFRAVYQANDMFITSWKKISNLPAENKFFFVASSSDSRTVYLAGGNGNAPVVMKTTNVGQSWTNIFRTENNENIFTGWSGHQGDRGWSYGEYALGFTILPGDPAKIAITDLGFVHLSSDGGTSWEQAYVPNSQQNPANSPTPKGKNYSSIGIENTTCWQLTWMDSANIFASFSDIKGIRSTDAGKTWSQNYSGHSDNSMYYVLRHPQTGIVYGATSTVHDMYQSTYLADSKIDGGNGKILFSTDKGANWLTLHDFQHPAVWLALDPQNPKKMYASVIHSSQGGIFVSNNISDGANSTWTKLAAPPRTQGHPFNIRVLNDGTLVASYSGRRAGSPLNFTASSGIFVSTDGGQSWLDRSDNAMKYWTKDIVIDPHDASQSTWYAAVFSGWGGAANNLGGLYKTTNRGQSWTKIFSDERVTSCTINPKNSSEMFVTTETSGMWYTSTLNSAMPNFFLVENYSFRQPERVFFNPYKREEIWVTSFGNGIKFGLVPKITADTLAAPKLIEPFDGAWNVANKISFYWYSVNGAQKYEIQIASDSIFSTTKFRSLVFNTSYSVQLENEKKYFWHVRAMNSSDTSLWSPVFRFTTSVFIPDSLSLLLPQNHAEKISLHPLLTWEKFPYADRYLIVMSQYDLSKPLPDSAKLEIDEFVSDTFYQVKKPLLPGTKYYWAINYSNIATTYFSPVWDFTTESANSVEENFPFDFSVNSDVIKFSLEEEKFVRIEAFDLTGRKISTICEEKFYTGKHRLDLRKKLAVFNAMFIFKVSIGERIFHVKHYFSTK